MISEEQMESALNLLADTDEPCAELKANVERAEYKAKKKKALIFEMTDGTVAERNAASETSSEYQAALDEYFTALQAYHGLTNRRATQMIVIDVWRSQNANMRRGNL